MSLKNALKIDSSVTPEGVAQSTEISSVPTESIVGSDTKSPRNSLYYRIVSNPKELGLWLSTFAVLNVYAFRFLIGAKAEFGIDPAVPFIFSCLCVFFAAFGIFALSSILVQEILNKTGFLKICYQANLLLANLILGGLGLFVAIKELPNYIYTEAAIMYATFSFLTALFIVLRDRLDHLVGSLGAYRVQDQIGQARVVRPEDTFLPSKFGGQGELFPKELSYSVPNSSLKSGDLVRIGEGESIPGDGVIVEGVAIIRERKIAAIFTEKLRGKGEEVFAGSKVILGAIDVKVGLKPEESLAAQLNPILDQSLSDGSSGVEESRNLSGVLFNTAIFFVAVIAGQFGYILGSSLETIIFIVATVLTVAAVSHVFSFSTGRNRVLVASTFARGILCKCIAKVKTLMKVESIVFLSDPNDLNGEEEVAGYFVMDARVDRKELGSVILGLCLKAEHPMFSAVAKHLIDNVHVTPKIIEAKDFKEYPGRGLCGIVTGAELTIGFEEFLIDRGVYLQSTEAIAHGQEGRVIYVAVGEEVIARLPLSESLDQFKETLLKPAHALGVRCLLLSRDPQNIADSRGKSLGFELSEIFGGLDENAIRAKLESLGTSLVVADSGNLLVRSVQSKRPDQTIVINLFDEINQNVGDGDITLFSRRPELVTFVNRLGAKLYGMSVERKIVSALVAVGVTALLGLGIFNPAFPLIGSLLFITVEMVQLFRIRRYLVPN